jgi:hypothetical protein
MRLCGFLGHACLLCNRSISYKNTEAEHSVDHCRVLLWDGPADTPTMHRNALHHCLFREGHDIPNDFSPPHSITLSARARSEDGVVRYVWQSKSTSSLRPMIERPPTGRPANVAGL